MEDLIISGSCISFPAGVTLLSVMTIVILAAGLSRRMGETNKLLLPYKGKTLIEHVVSEALAFSSKVVVVTGFERELIEKQLKDYGVTFLHNPAYETGQESSIRAAVDLIDDELIITPGDLPLLTEGHFERAHSELEGYLAARACFEGRPGHPVVLSVPMIQIIRENREERVKTLIERRSHNFYESDRACVADIDTSADWENFLTADLL